MQSSLEPIVQVEGLEKTYTQGDGNSLTILKDCSFTLASRECASIVGQSGSGKSTFLNILALLDKATKGKVIVGKEDLELLYSDDKRLSIYRNQYIGIVFQFHFLIKGLSALENVLVPAYIAGTPKDSAIKKARALLTSVGLKDRMSHLEGELSGGERQRVAVARSLINSPSLILADEPTGNLDPDNAKRIGELLYDMARQYKAALLIVTHDMTLAKKADTIWTIEDKRLVRVGSNDI